MRRQVVHFPSEIQHAAVFGRFIWSHSMTGIKKILIAEDEEDIIWAVTKSLTRMNPNIEVYWARDGNQAYEMLQQERFDLVISDVCMPGRDGIELSMEIRKLFPQMKIILMTSHSSAEIMHRTRALSNYRYIEKPFDIAYLRHLVFEALNTDMPLGINMGYDENYLSRG